MLRRTLAIAVVATLGAAPVARADPRPSDGHLVLAGLGMAVPMYFSNVILHEGSHGVMTRLLGGEVSDYWLLPGWHHRSGRFYFAYVDTRGLLAKGQRAAMLIAPKLTDALMLGTYAFLELGDHLPDNAYGHLAFTVAATGFWVDFSRDVVAWWDYNDTVKIYNMMGATTELRRLPLRLLHAGLAVAGSIAIIHGYQRVFDDDPAATPRLVPIMVGTF